ncbi:MAG: helix-turn-helix transcriptional regulator [Cytophagales bacterium]|nr:helix-turn-helix transcriptional regulator [Cytophagales bacterium]
MKIHEKLRRLRRNRNLSQSDVAIEIGVDYTTYNSYERDGGKIQLKTIEKISTFYGYKNLSGFFSDKNQEDGSTLSKTTTGGNPIQVIVELDGDADKLAETMERLKKMNKAIEE